MGAVFIDMRVQVDARFSGDGAESMHVLMKV